MAMSPDRVQVDSHAFLLGRERPPPEECDKIFGRQHGDSEKLFPRYTHASAATTGEVVVNGKVLRIWTFQQLETLARGVLKERAMTIRDAIGEARCPPIPSGQKEDLIRWIIHMQEEIAGQTPDECGRTGGYGSTHQVPKTFCQDTQERPITREREVAMATSSKFPFGPRATPAHDASRDHYSDLKLQRKEFKEAPNLGIATMRPGGEGKRHLPATHNMASCGVSAAEPRGIQTLKPTGEGRRYLSCDDHLMEQKRENEAYPDGGRLESSPARSNSPGPRATKEPVRHVSETHMSGQGVAMPLSESPIGGERRRHAQPQDRMVNHGTSAPHADVNDRNTGRKYLDSFAGSRSRYSDSHDTYQSTWKKDPSRLQGTSLIV